MPVANTVAYYSNKYGHEKFYSKGNYIIIPCCVGDRNSEQEHVSLRPPADRELQGQLRAREEEQANVPHVG